MCVNSARNTPLRGYTAWDQTVLMTSVVMLSVDANARSTKMNEMSSRSHAVFIIIAEQSETTFLPTPDLEGRQGSSRGTARVMLDLTTGQAQGVGTGVGGEGKQHTRTCFKVGKLNLVDLAGSERYVRLEKEMGGSGVLLQCSGGELELVLKLTSYPVSPL